MPKPVTDPDLLAQLNAPERAEVAPTARVWGDQEAEAAGLYENTSGNRGARPVTDPAILAQLNGGGNVTVRPFNERFVEPTEPENAPELRAGLREEATARMRGPSVDPGVQMLVDFQNQAIAGGQRTTPLMRAQMPNLISNQVFENDAGLAAFRDPETGQIVEADSGKHVILRDPEDNRLKVFARTSETTETPVDAAARVLSPGLAAGAVTRRPAIPVPTGGRVSVSASDVMSTAKPFYRQFDATSEAVGQLQSSGYANRIKDALRLAKVPQHLADEVYRSVDEIGEGATLSDLRSVKELIGQSARSNDSRVRQAAAVASKEINKIIGEVSRSAASSLKKADEIYGTGKSLQTLQRAGAVADLRTGRAGYGGNATNTIKQVISPIVQRAVEGKTTGFRPNEIQAMRELVEGTTTTNTLRTVGQLSPTRGSIATLGGIATGGGAGVAAAGPIGLVGAVALPALGAASNKLAAVLTGKQFERIKDLVAKRSPAYAEAVRKAAERYEKTQLEFVNDPSPNRFAAYLSATRQLSSGLNRDGVSITSGELLRAIQGPMKSAADDENPEPERVINQ